MKLVDYEGHLKFRTNEIIVCSYENFFSQFSEKLKNLAFEDHASFQIVIHRISKKQAEFILNSYIVSIYAIEDEASSLPITFYASPVSPSQFWKKFHITDFEEKIVLLFEKKRNNCIFFLVKLFS
jgi:hypothetical protein